MDAVESSAMAPASPSFVPDTIPPSHDVCSQGPPFRYIGEGSCDGFEQPAKYKRGGLHPVLLGDILPEALSGVSGSKERPIYRIIMKLGYGEFATVWLARDIKYGRFVAVKVCEAFDSSSPRPSPGSNEAAILKSLQTAGHGNGRHSAVIELVDSFIIKGPNGYHECLVTEIVASLDGLDSDARGSPLVLRQIVDGFAHLHEQGLIHGDPHPANFGVAAPLIQHLSEDDIEDTLGTPDTVPLVPRSSTFPKDAAPAYIVRVTDENLDYLLTQRNAFPSGKDIIIKILDFGRARKVDEIHGMPGGVPYAFRPPEVFIFEESGGKLGDMWSTAADVWSVGCTMFSIMFNCDLISTWGSVDDIFRRCLELGGNPPSNWLEFWNSRRSCESDGRSLSAQQAWSDVKKKNLSRKRVSDEEADLFLDLLRQMIVTKPEDRWTMAQLLEHPFFGKTGTR